MRQEELFSNRTVAEPASVIPGFVLELDYVTPEQEHQLITQIDLEPWQTNYRRRIQQYGLGYSSDSNKSPSWLRDFPPWLRPLAERVSKDAFDRPAENCVINEYVPPQGIGPHRDYGAFGDVVACVSLGSDIVIDFINSENNLKIPLHLPARSFWKISGDARWKWLHGIAPRLTDVMGGERRLRSRRISITFRTAKS